MNRQGKPMIDLFDRYRIYPADIPHFMRLIDTGQIDNDDFAFRLFNYRHYDECLNAVLFTLTLEHAA